MCPARRAASVRALWACLLLTDARAESPDHIVGRQRLPVQAPAIARHGSRESAAVSGPQGHEHHPAGGAFANLSLFTGGLEPDLPWLRSETFLPSQEGKQVSSARQSSTAPTSPASPNAKPLKSILKGAAPSPRSSIADTIHTVGSLLFQDNNLGSPASPGTARSRVTWSGETHPRTSAHARTSEHKSAYACKACVSAIYPSTSIIRTRVANGHACCCCLPSSVSLFCDIFSTNPRTQPQQRQCRWRS